MNSYHIEHAEAFRIAADERIAGGNTAEDPVLCKALEYLRFRESVALFLEENFNETCTRHCFENRLSACCSREGIIAFFADVVINTLVSKPEEISAIQRVLSHPNTGYKCVYLGKKGCMWHIKPIVCEMFLCDRAMEMVFLENDNLKKKWFRLKEAAKRFQWPDQPVLFDWIETEYMARGYDATLMYFHKSPGLLMVKKKAGLLP